MTRGADGTSPLPSPLASQQPRLVGASWIRRGFPHPHLHLHALTLRRWVLPAIPLHSPPPFFFPLTSPFLLQPQLWLGWLVAQLCAFCPVSSTHEYLAWELRFGLVGA